MANLPCEDGGGSLNNPNGSPSQIGTNNSDLKPYQPYDPCMGQWEITSLSPDQCAANDQRRQESYVAEQLNISGAPLNVFKMLGVHEQGQGSVLSEGNIFASQAYPGYPVTGINSGTQPWRSLQQGQAVTASSVGVDFGIKRIKNGQTEYEPQKTKWTSIGAINLTQANTPDNYAKQVRVEIADGTCSASQPIFWGGGNGSLVVTGIGSDATQGIVTVSAVTATTFGVVANLQDGSVIGLGSATVGVPFYSVFLNFTINAGSSPFISGDQFTIQVNYEWKRVGIYNIIQSPDVQTLPFKTNLLVRAVKVTPTLFTGNGSWEVAALDVLDSVPTHHTNIQDLFFNENRDRDYAKEPVMIKAQFDIADSATDLARFGLNILDTYNFNVSFAAMVNAIGRPLLVGDIIEVIPEMQYDQNLQPVRKFLEVTDTGWSSSGFTAFWKPTVFRFSAQQALPSQETRDIFGTLDTQKYMIADPILNDGLAPILNDMPLTQTEEIIKNAADKVPETGSDDQRSTIGAPLPPALPPVNPKGQPPAAPHNGKQGIYIEDGLPPNGEPYGEGFKLPDITTVSDGDYFRLYYPPETKIQPRLYRFSAMKNRWIYQETDRRNEYSSYKPSVRSILQSDTKQGLGKKLT